MIKTVPVFPGSEPLSLEHKPLFDGLLKRHPPEISEYTFTNLFAWRNAYNFGVARLDDLVVVSSAVKGRTTYYYPLGYEDAAAAAAALLERGGKGCALARIPHEIAVQLAADSRFVVKRDPDNDDYVYRTADLIHLAGRKYDGKRNLIRNFRSSHAYEYLDLDHSHERQCLAFKEKWCLLKDCDGVESLRNEKQAVREMIVHCAEFGLIGGGIKVDGELAGIAIGEALNKQTLVLHVLKAHSHMVGVYQTLLNEFLAHRAAAFAYVNMEQDLGVPGLRKSKESYSPAHMVRKYVVTTAE